MHLLSDRHKRKTILATTGWLPRPLRVAARYRLLAALERGRGLRAKVIIIGHPKSGTTWLRAMLSRFYHVRYDLPGSVLIKSDELARLDPRVPRFLITNGHYSYERVIDEALADDQPPALARNRRIVLLARNPCDVAVSWYFQFTKRISTAKRELINATLRCPVDHRTVSMWDFVTHREIGLPSLIEYLNGWHRTLSRLDHSLVLRYEDLRIRPTETLRELLVFIEGACTEQELEDAVKFASFDNLRALEAQGFFTRGGLSPRDPADPETFKVRRGKIQGYRDYFTTEQAAGLEALVQRELSPAFGYGRPCSEASGGST